MAQALKVDLTELFDFRDNINLPPTASTFASQ